MAFQAKKKVCVQFSFVSGKEYFFISKLHSRHTVGPEENLWTLAAL
jgi:hypothetical protein